MQDLSKFIGASKEIFCYVWMKIYVLGFGWVRNINSKKLRFDAWILHNTTHSNECFLTALIFISQIFGTQTKLSFGSTLMANQTYTQDGLMRGVKLRSDDHSQRISRFKIFPDFSNNFWKSSIQPSERPMVWFFVLKPFPSI